MTMEEANKAASMGATETGEPDIIDPSGKLEEFGLNHVSTPVEKLRCWDRQEAFLKVFRTNGRVGESARAIGLTRWAPTSWQKLDLHGFRERMSLAHKDWCEDVIEARINDRLASPEGNRGSDILLMFQAKAEMPEKYRETVTIIDTQDTKDMLTQLRRIGSPRVIEGKAKVIDETGPDSAKNSADL